MSSAESISASSQPVAAEHFVADAAGGVLKSLMGTTVRASAAVMTGAVREAVSSVERIRQMARQGNYPGADMHVSFAALGEITGYETLLASQGFTLEPVEDVIVATAPTGQSLFLFDSPVGIGVMGEETLLRASQQTYNTMEIGAAVLRASGYAVETSVEGDAIVLSASDRARAAEDSHVEVAVYTDGEADVDTRSLPRPDCDIIQQQIRLKVKENLERRLGVDGRGRADDRVRLRQRG